MTRNLLCAKAASERVTLVGSDRHESGPPLDVWRPRLEHLGRLGLARLLVGVKMNTIDTLSNSGRLSYLAAARPLFRA